MVCDYIETTDQHDPLLFNICEEKLHFIRGWKKMLHNTFAHFSHESKSAVVNEMIASTEKNFLNKMVGWMQLVQ